MPSALNPEQQVEVYHKLRDHFKVVMGGPCKEFPGYPFRADWGKGGVSITAVIEHFEEGEQTALVAHFNKWLKGLEKGSPTKCGVFQGILPYMLRAEKLQRVEGGLQFGAKKAFGQRLMDELKLNSECKDLWVHIETYQDFLQSCQIRYTYNRPFGNTSARQVTFTAHQGTPIFLMLYLLRALDYDRTGAECGFGQVILTDRNGLPMDGDEELILHFSSGLVDWGRA